MHAMVAAANSDFLRRGGMAGSFKPLARGERDGREVYLLDLRAVAGLGRSVSAVGVRMLVDYWYSGRFDWAGRADDILSQVHAVMEAGDFYRPGWGWHLCVRRIWRPS